MKVVPGSWDGEASSLAGIEADYALYGEIIALNFTGEGNLPNAKTRGRAAISIRLGSRLNRTVVRREVEVAPEEFNFILLDNRYEHIGRMEQVIRRSLSRVIKDGLTDLVRRVNAATPAPQAPPERAPAGGSNPFERFQRR